VLASLPYRYGRRLGVLFGSVILTWVAGMNLLLVPDGTYSQAQFPVRMIFLTVTFVLSAAFAHMHGKSIRQLEVQKRQSLLVERVSRERIQFLGSVSHELRTPLTSILAFASLLKRNKSGSLDASQLKQVRIIEDSGRHLAAIIDDLLDASSLERGQLTFHDGEFEFSGLAHEVIDGFGPEIEQRGQRLVVDVLTGDGLLEADRRRFRQVLANLISNASKYSPSGAVIRLRAAFDGGVLAVSVENPGSLSPVDVTRLFDLFYRADNETTRSQPGTGIGLYICKQVVERYGGDISAVCHDGQVTVSFRLPTRRPGSQKVAAAA
jgi:Amt family ammonium transporter